MTNAAGKILNTQNSLYSNIIGALSGSALSSRFTNLLTGTETNQLSSGLTFSYEIPMAVSWGAVQGVARNSTNWFGVSTASIAKRALDGELLVTNSTPFAGLPSALNHCGDSHVDDQYLYVPIGQYISASQTAPVKVIAWYNVSDLSLAGHFDISSTDEKMNASGLTLSPDGTEFWVTSYRTADVNDEFTNSIWRYSKTTGEFLGRHVLSERVLGIQGIAYNPSAKGIFISSWAQPEGARPRIYIYDDNYQLQQITRPVGIADSSSSSNEMEGICYWDGDIYFHVINRSPRLLGKQAFIAKAESRANLPQLIESVPEEGTILFRGVLPTRPPTSGGPNSLFDNKDAADLWESWHNNARTLNWRVNNAQSGCVISSVFESSDTRIISLSWRKDGSQVVCKLGLNGAWQSTVTQTWVDAPAQGIWLGGANPSNGIADAQFADVIALNKELSDSELLSVASDFDAFYTTDSEPVEPPQGVVTIDSVSVTEQTATITYSYNDTDQTGFEYRINAGAAQSATNPLILTDLSVGSYTIEIRAVNNSGVGTWSSPSNFSVVSNSLNISIVNIPNGDYVVRLFNSTTKDFIAAPTLTFAGGLAQYETLLSTGTTVEGYVFDGNNPPLAGATIYGVVTNG